MNPRHKGILIALFGITCVSPEAVVIQFLSEGGTNPWTIVFWKMLLSVAVSASYAVYEAGGFRSLWKSMVVGRRYYTVAIPLQCGIDICFTMAFVYTSAANTLLLYSLSPLWCAILGRVFLGDALPRHTIAALILALGCMLIIFVPDIVLRRQGGEGDDGHSSLSSGKGNIFALFIGIFSAGYITIVRKGGKSSKNINLIGAAATGALLSSIIAVIVKRGDILPNDYWRGNGGELWQFWLAMTAQGLMIGIIFVAVSIAPKLATGAEVALVLLLEAILGPLWVFLAYGDAPPIWTIVGGSLLLTVLVLHESRPLFKKAHREIQRMTSQKSLRESQHASIRKDKMGETDVESKGENESDEADAAIEENAVSEAVAQYKWEDNKVVIDCPCSA